MRIGLLEIAVLAALAVGLLLFVVARRNRPRVDVSALPPGPRTVAWAYGVLYEAGVDADADPPYAASLLRRADPTLTDAEALELVRRML